MLVDSLKNRAKKITIKSVCLSVVLAIFANAVLLPAATANAEYKPIPKLEQNLVIILADQTLLNDSKNYEGNGSSNQTLQERIERYAEDITQKLNSTDVVITDVPRNESPTKIASLLKRTYFNESELNQDKKLIGVVLIGDVPLPNVNKSGNKFESLYPYTDFIDPVFTYNTSTNYFEYTGAADSPEPEIWHGVIKIDSTNQNDYAVYFDKNHAFHQGEPEFANFEKQMFLAEPIHEKEGFADVLYQNYQNYLKYAEQTFANKFSAKLANLVTPIGDFAQGLSNAYSSNPSLRPANPQSVGQIEIPDIQSKSVIDAAFSRLTDLYATFISKERNAVIGTGRYDESNYLSPLTGIAKKDEYALQYLHKINLMVQSKINELVSTASEQIYLTKGAKLSGEIVFKDGTTQAIETFNFANNSPLGTYLSEKASERQVREGNVRLSDLIFNPSSPFVLEALGAAVTANPLGVVNALLDEEDSALEILATVPTMINGTPESEITSADQCRIYRGGGQKGDLDSAVKLVRGPVQGVNEDGQNANLCYRPWEGMDAANTWKTVSFDNTQFGRNSCTLFLGQNLKDEYRFQPTELDYKGKLTHEACFNMRPFSQYQSIINVAGVNTQTSQTYEQRIELANSTTDSAEIVLKAGSYNLSLETLLKSLQGYTGDPKDWNAWSSYLLANPVKTEFESINPYGADNPIEKVVLKVEQIGKSKKIPSIVIHNDPVARIVRNAVESGNSKTLPIDSKPYVTYVDKAGNKQELVYPNIFDYKTFDEYLQKLQEIERLLNSSELLPLVEGNQTRLANAGKIMQTASKSSINEFISWRNFDINQKYADVLSDTLNLGTAVDMLNIPKTFEYGILTGEVFSNNINIQVFKEPSETNGLLNISKNNTPEQTQLEQLNDQFKQEQTRASQEASAISNRNSEKIGFFEWPAYIADWIRETANLAGSKLSPVAKKNNAFESFINSSNKEIAQIKIDTISDNLTKSDTNNHYFVVNALDTEGNIVVGRSDYFDVSINGGNFIGKIDDDLSRPGIQIFAVRGTEQIKFSPTAETVVFTAKLSDKSSQKSIKIHSELTVNVVFDNQNIAAGTNGSNFKVTIKDKNTNQIVNIKPKVSLESTSFGEIAELPASTDNTFNYSFKPSTNAGKVNLIIELPGAAPFIKELVVLAGTPKKLQFDALVSKVDSKSQTNQSAKLILADEFGNKVNSNLTSIAVEAFGGINLQNNSFNITNGEATVSYTLNSGALSQTSYIKATKSGLAEALHKVELTSDFNLDNFVNFNNPILYYELRLFGTNPKNIATKSLPKGKTQLISTITTDLKGKKPVLYIHPTGGYEMPETIYKTVYSSDAESISTQVVDNKGARVATIKVKPNLIEQIKTTEPDSTQAGIYIKNVKGNSFKLELLNRVLQINSKPTVRFNSDNVPIALQPNITFIPSPNAKFFSFFVAENGNPVAEINLNFEQGGAVSIIPNSQNLNFTFAKGSTLPSSNSLQGYIFYSDNQTLSSNQLPSSGDFRLENSQDTPQVSLGDGNKSGLLFAAGVIAGEANRPYLSEAGILIGDPTVSIESQDNDLSIGEFIAKGSTAFTKVIDLPNEVIFTDEAGFISKLDKETKTFHKNLIHIPTGIQNIVNYRSDGENNQLIILTKEACLKNDSCLYILDLKPDSATLVNLEVQNTAKTTQILAYDLNNDNQNELITFDEDKILNVYWTSGVNLSLSPTRIVNLSSIQSENPPIINIVVDENDPTPDRLPDFKLIYKGLDTIYYLQSNFNRSTNRLTYDFVPFTETKSNTQEVIASQNLAPTVPQGRDAQKQFVKNLKKTTFEADDDGDGYPSMYDNVLGGLNDVANTIEDAVSRFSCSGKGCLAMPINYAFLVPGNTPPTVVLPVFGWGCPNIIPTWPPTPHQSCAGGRIYVSPTLTGEITGSVCVGPYLGALCWTTRIADMGKMCEIINTGIQDLMSAATNAVTDATGGIVSVGGGGGGGSNITIPGFPKILTDWFSNQLTEIIDKLTDLPDLTIIVPEPQSLLGYFNSTEEDTTFEDVNYLGIEEVLAEISAMPLFDINIEKFYIEYPVPPAPEEFDDFVASLKAIYEANLEEVNNTLRNWGCYGRDFKSLAEFRGLLTSGQLVTEVSNTGASIPGCVDLSVRFFDIFLSFEANLDTLESYRTLPRDLFEVQNFLSDYANQILGYADIILDRTAGFLVSNTAALVEWQNFFITIQNLIEEFKIIIDFVTNFMTSCDDCRTTRTDVGSIEFLVGLFLNIPTELPVIEFPKLPNITLDVSQIEAEVNLTLPALDFKPLPIVLPDLNMLVIDLPDAPPVNLSADFGRFGLNLFVALPPAPDIKGLIINLPDLPELEIPVMPTIPKPPNLEALSVDFFAQIEVPLEIIGTILRILCILLKGIVPTPELNLASHIKSITARPLDIVLPIDIGFGFQLPKISYEYLEEYRFILETYLRLDVDALTNAVGSTVGQINSVTRKLTDTANYFLQQTADSVPSGSVRVPGSDAVENFEINGELDIPIDVEIDGNLSLKSNIDTLNNSFRKISESMPETINLVATSETVTRDQALARAKNLDFNDLKVPTKVMQKYSQLLAYRNSISDQNKYIASLNPTTKSSNGIVVKKYVVAQAQPTVPTAATAANFVPSEGLYVYDSETKSTKKLIAYSGETGDQTHFAMLQTDSDSNKEVIFTRDNEIFLKDPIKSVNSANGRVTNIDWEDLNADLTLLNSLSLSKPTVQLQSDTVTFSFDQNYASQVVVLDLYAANLNSPGPLNRYVYLFNSADPQEWQNRSTIEFSNNQINKDQFSNMYVGSGGSSFSLNLDNQPYQFILRTLNTTTGELEVIQPVTGFTPNICGDLVAPEINLTTGTTITVPVLVPVDIDLSGSTDEGSAIGTIYLDTKLNIDNDGDGDATNDQDLIGPPNNRAASKFRLSPFQNAGVYKVKAWIEDKAGNSDSVEITINVIVPTIQITNQTETQISGNIDPGVAGFSVKVIRDRNGQLETLGETNTNATGEFSLGNLSDNKTVSVFDSANNKLFLINQLTGAVRPLNNKAIIKVDKNSGTIGLYSQNELITTITKVSNANQDIAILSEIPDTQRLNSASNSLAIDTKQNDNITIQRIPGDDPVAPGGIKILNQTELLAMVSTNGKIVVSDRNLDLRLEAISDVNTPQWFEFIYGNNLVAKLFVGTSRENVEIIDNLKVVESPTTQTQNIQSSSPNNTQTGFRDVSITDPNAPIINFLQQTGVIEGVIKEDGRYFEGSRQITRAEYSKIILQILCIEPSAESKVAPSVFSDIPFASPLPWFFDDTKETKLQNFFTGYLGEINPSNGLPPFKPFGSITRAEATKVILEALQEAKVIDMSSLPVSTPWYTNFITVAQNLNPYFINRTAQQSFILTPQEASEPNRLITRNEFAQMAVRVLQIRNCKGVDLNSLLNSGLNQTSNNSTSNNNQNNSSNAGQSQFSSQATQTAQQIVPPTNLPNTAGIFIENINCVSCPCKFRLDYDDDLRENDTIFAVIMSENGEIIATSNVTTKN